MSTSATEATSCLVAAPAGPVGYVRRGSRAGVPVVLLHGFLGRAEDWDEIGGPLAADRCVVAVDLPGHGRTVRAGKAGAYDMHAAIVAVERVLDELGIGEAIVAGYSMGGRVALALGCERPARVRALVLESASAGLGDELVRQRRRADDEALADALESRPLEHFIEDWEALPLFETQRRLPDAVRSAQRRRRMDNRPTELAASLRELGTGAQPYYGERLAAVAVPVLVVAGALDRRFAGMARALADDLPSGRRLVVPDAGHNVHLERPDAFVAAVTAFAGEVDSDRAASPQAPAHRSVPARPAQ